MVMTALRWLRIKITLWSIRVEIMLGAITMLIDRILPSRATLPHHSITTTTITQMGWSRKSRHCQSHAPPPLVDKAVQLKAIMERRVGKRLQTWWYTERLEVICPRLIVRYSTLAVSS